jgi:hypothetical protein
MWGVPIVLVLLYALLMVHLHYLRKYVRMDPLMRAQAFRNATGLMVLYSWAGTLFQGIFLLYAASQYGWTWPLRLVVLAFVASLPLQMLPFVFTRSIELVIAVVAATGLFISPFLAAGMFFSLP